jgi:hypothetical protein
MRMLSDARAELLDHARLANARLAHHQHHLSAALAGALPSAEQQAHFIVPSDEWRQWPYRRAMCSASYRAGLNHSIELDGMFDSLEL